MHERACVTGILDMFFVRWRVGEEEMGVGEEFLKGIGGGLLSYLLPKKMKKWFWGVSFCMLYLCFVFCNFN